MEMMAPILSYGTTTRFQGFVLHPDYTGIDTGTVTDVVAAWCHVGGELEFTVPGSDPVAFTFSDGDQFLLPAGTSVTINGGTWSFMK